MRIKKWEEIKKQKKKEKRPWPYGCSKSWLNVYTSSVRNHIALGCPNIGDGPTKIDEFYGLRKRQPLLDGVIK